MASNIIIGVNTHKATHVAVAIDTNGTRLATFSAPATSNGYLALESWAQKTGAVMAKAPALLASHGIATMTAAEMLILVGDDPARIRSGAAMPNYAA